MNSVRCMLNLATSRLFIEGVNPSLAEPPLKLNGGLAKTWVVWVKWAISHLIRNLLDMSSGGHHWGYHSYIISLLGNYNSFEDRVSVYSFLLRATDLQISYIDLTKIGRQGRCPGNSLMARSIIAHLTFFIIGSCFYIFSPNVYACVL